MHLCLKGGQCPPFFFYSSFMQFEQPVEKKILDIISPSIEGMGYEVVRVKIMGAHNGRQTLQIMLDRSDDEDIGVDDCEKASRQISAVLDVEDPISEGYYLEVSSPGIDRPLTRLKDFEAFKGFEARINTAEKIEGRKKFTGKLIGTSENLVIIKLPECENNIEISFDRIKSAKLVLNDELIDSLSNNSKI